MVKPGRPRCYTLKRFFFKRLLASEYNYQGVIRWPTSAKIDVSSLNLQLRPVNLDNFHWGFAAIDWMYKEFLYLDSMYGTDTFVVIPSLRRWLLNEVKNKHEKERVKALKIDSWKIVQRPTYLPSKAMMAHEVFSNCTWPIICSSERLRILAKTMTSSWPKSGVFQHCYGFLAQTCHVSDDRGSSKFVESANFINFNALS